MRISSCQLLEHGAVLAEIERTLPGEHGQPADRNGCADIRERRQALGYRASADRASRITIDRLPGAR
ncbi:MAG: hypothetical protein U5K33_03295 [Halofilum sp. (in: g-proteobacteria)]|nr:hypothetical protein [Halofilum sp. (in: g-proteobacteria)]